VTGPYRQKWKLFRKAGIGRIESLNVDFGVRGLNEFPGRRAMQKSFI